MIRTQVNVEQEFWNHLDEIATEWKRTGKTDRHAGAGTVASHLMEQLRQNPQLLNELLSKKKPVQNGNDEVMLGYPPESDSDENNKPSNHRRKRK